MLLKSSDFVSHDLTTESVFEHCDPEPSTTELPVYELELVLRKWYPVNPSREVRCFVRNGQLIGEFRFASAGDGGRILTLLLCLAVSQRDTNHYDFLMEVETQEKIAKSVSEFWEDKIKPRMKEQKDCRISLPAALLTTDSFVMQTSLISF